MRVSKATRGAMMTSILIGVLFLAFIGLWLFLEIIDDGNPKTITKREINAKDQTKLRKLLIKGDVGCPLVMRATQPTKPKMIQKHPFGNPTDVIGVPCEARGLVVGVSGTGKTNLILSQIISWVQSGKNFVVTDVKPEIYGVLVANGVLEAYDYTPIVINPTNPNACGYNMLIDVQTDSQLEEIIALLVPANEDNQAFAQFGRTVFKAVILHLQQENPHTSIADAYDYITSHSSANKMLDHLQDQGGDKVKALVKTAKLSADNERFISSGMSTLTNALSFLANETIANSVRGEYSMAELLEQPKIALFLQYEQATAQATESLYSAMVQHIINVLMSNYQSREDVFLMFDELLNGGKIDNLAHKFNLIRSYKMPAFIYIQSIQGLYEKYGKLTADKLISSCDLKICYRVNDYETAEYFSKLSGITKVHIINQSRTTHKGVTTTAKSSQVKDEPLVTVDDMLNLGVGEALCAYNGACAIVKMPIHYKDTIATERAEIVSF